MPRFVGKARKLVYFAIGAQIFCADQQANLPAGKLGDQPMNQRNGRVLDIIHGKQDFVVRIILPAEARIIFVAGEIYAAHGFQQAYWRRVASQLALALVAEEAPSCKSGRDVIRQWRGGQK